MYTKKINLENFIGRFSCCKCNGLVMYTKKINLENHLHYYNKKQAKTKCCRYIAIITTAHLHLMKSKLRSCFDLDVVRDVVKICNGGSLGQLSRLEMSLTTSFRRSTISKR